jgi:hypothetical protein
MNRPIIVKVLCWLLFGVVCFVTLIALLCAEENLRGKWAWGKCQRDLEAKGEHLDIARFIPPPVPEAQNLAESPLFKPLQTALTSNTNPDLRDQPLGKISDYAGHNEKAQSVLKVKFGSWQTGNPRDLRGWQEYYRTAFPELGLSGSAEQDIVAATDNLNGLFNAFRGEIEKRPVCRFDLQYQKGPLARFSHLQSLQYLALVLSLRATAELRLNRPADALDDVQLGFRIIGATADEPMLISGLVRIGQMSVLMGPIWEGIATHRWSDAQLGVIAAELRRLDFRSDYCRAIRMERAMGCVVLQWVINNPRALDMMGPPPGVVFRAALPAMKPWSGCVYQNLIHESVWLQETISAVDPVNRYVDVPRAVRAQEAAGQGMTTPYNMLARSAVLALDASFLRFAVAQTWANEAIVACAIERYRIARGALPASLDDLHVADLPGDVTSSGPLHYRLTPGDSNYLLYSIGWDGEDDGGTIALNDNGTISFEKGDWVWPRASIQAAMSAK